MNDGMVSIFKESTVKRVIDIDHPVIKGDSEIHELFIGRNVYINSKIHVITDTFIKIDLAIGLSIRIHDDAFNYNGEYIRFTTTDDKNRIQSLSDLCKDVETVTWNDSVINADNIGGLFRIDIIHRGETKYTTEIGILQNFNSNIVHFDCLSKIPNERHITCFDKWISIPAHHNNTEVLVKRLESEDVKFF
jgi:hypothetical protein